MGLFITQLFLFYFVAFGVLLGASLLAGMSAVITMQPPSLTMLKIAQNVKIWAVIAAIGGTIDPIRAIESNYMYGEMSEVIKQILYIVSAFLGAHTASILVAWICGDLNP